MFISHKTEKYSYLEGIRLALNGGIKLIQLRMKEAKTDDIIKTAEYAKAECRRYNATLIIDDYVEMVVKCGLDGVHLGKNDMPVDKARALLGKDKIIGATANTLTDVKSAANADADYVGLGPFAYTTTKKQLSPILGLSGYRNIVAELKKNNIQIPLYAIGGITSKDIKSILDTGIHGIAVSGAVLSSAKPIEMAKEFCNFAADF